eukprot:625202-Hanusia_phi.AAC.3
MPFKDETIKRQRQRQLKSRERTFSKKLLHALDALVPSTAREDRQLNGVLPSKRSNMHLLEDLRAALERIKKRRVEEEDQACRITSELLREGLLSCRTERLLVVELPSWKVVDGSSRLLADYEGSRLLGDPHAARSVSPALDRRERQVQAAGAGETRQRGAGGLEGGLEGGRHRCEDAILLAQQRRAQSMSAEAENEGHGGRGGGVDRGDGRADHGDGLELERLA